MKLEGKEVLEHHAQSHGIGEAKTRTTIAEADGERALGGGLFR